jgi:flavin reductase (DIM6/NTAB) family NADH-FMN oxidoreductase RutF
MTSTIQSSTLAERISSEEFRHVLGHFGSGVTVISGMHADEPVGFACQSFSALSIDPPLVTFSVARTSTSWPRIEASGSFCVNVLSAAQEKTCRDFAVSGADKFAGVAWTPTPDTGSPALTGALATIDCDVEAVHPGGDHVIVVGRVRALRTADDDAEPLLFYRAAFRRLTP